MSTNTEVAQQFEEIADILDVLGERFKPEAYRRAARSVEALGEDLKRVAGRGGLDAIPGVGEALSAKIREYLSTGRIAYLDGLRKQLPAGLLDLMQLPGVGPKTARRFWVELGIEGPAELSAAIDARRLDTVKGFGERKIGLLQQALQQAAGTTGGKRMPLRVAWLSAKAIADYLRSRAEVTDIEPAGSLRRRRESIGDLDILVAARVPETVFDAFAHMPTIQKVVLRGGTKMTARVSPGVQVDLRVVEPGAFGAALQYFTGSKDHNIRLRSIARDKGLKVNEYGVWRGEERIAGATEEQVYHALGIPIMPPEIRENRGEIDGALSGEVPRLVGRREIHGDLHVHLEKAPMAGDVEQWSQAAQGASLDYVGLIVRENDVAETRLRLQSLPSGRGRPAFHVGVEFTLPTGGKWPDLPIGAEFAVGVPEQSMPPANPPLQGSPPLFLSHLGLGKEGEEADPDRARAWRTYAQAGSTALEVSARGALEGLDSSGARQAQEEKIQLHLTASASEPGELELLEVAVGLARRGWVTRASVLNAREEVLRSGRRQAASGSR